MSGIEGDSSRSSIVALVNPADNNLPTSQAYRQPAAVLPAAECLNSTITAVNEASFNLFEPEKELLRWHYRLGHKSFQSIQFLMRSGVLTKNNNKHRLHQAACSLTQLPKRGLLPASTGSSTVARIPVVLAPLFKIESAPSRMVTSYLVSRYLLITSSTAPKDGYFRQPARPSTVNSTPVVACSTIMHQVSFTLSSRLT